MDKSITKKVGELIYERGKNKLTLEQDSLGVLVVIDTEFDKMEISPEEFVELIDFLNEVAKDLKTGLEYSFPFKPSLRD